jgi:putative nucleotidyltransferase with HDIG domain
MQNICDNCADLTMGNNWIPFFMDVIDLKDPYTQGHSHHVQVVTEKIYDSLPDRYQKKLDKAKLLLAALLHDIGKIKTPDIILNKDATLSDNEWDVMKAHPKEGAELIKKTVFSDISRWILYHHENIDGKGYYGLKGSEIPLEAKIIAVADTFSALRNSRIYRPAKSIEATIKILDEVRGQQLDDDIVGYFLKTDKEILEKLYCGCDTCVERRSELEKKVNASMVKLNSI